MKVELPFDYVINMIVRDDIRKDIIENYKEVRNLHHPDDLHRYYDRYTDELRRLCADTQPGEISLDIFEQAMLLVTKINRVVDPEDKNKDRIHVSVDYGKNGEVQFTAPGYVYRFVVKIDPHYEEKYYSYEDSVKHLKNNMTITFAGRLV